MTIAKKTECTCTKQSYRNNFNLAKVIISLEYVEQGKDWVYSSYSLPIQSLWISDISKIFSKVGKIKKKLNPITEMVQYADLY